MGASFTNLQVRKAAKESICAALPKLTRDGAYVSPEKDGWVTVYLKASEDQSDEGGRIAAGLSKMLKTDVIAFLVYDSDIAMYWLYRNGELLDQFDSAPDYFEEKEFGQSDAGLGGDPDTLLPLCVPGTTRKQLEEVLHPSDGYPLMAEDIVEQLSKLLGIDDLRSNLGFTYFEMEGEEIVPDVAEFEPIGKGAERKEARQRTFAAPMAAVPDVYSIAITMLAQVWNRRDEQHFQMLSRIGKDPELILKQIRDGHDRAARDMLKKSPLPDLPAIDELKAARDHGPEALAALIAKKTPGQLADVGIGVARAGIELFLAALFKHGLDPNSPNVQGYTTLQAAEIHGLNSSIYRLAKAAAEGKQQ